MITRLLQFIGAMIYRLGLAKWVIRRGRGNSKVLLFHDVSPVESPFVAGLGTTLSPTIFRDHLSFLREHYDFVSIDAIGEPSGGRPRVAIVFDDGYRSIYQHAAPALRDVGAPALVYLITRAVDSAEPVWVNALNWHLNTMGEPACAIAREALSLPADADAGHILAEARLAFDRARIDGLLSRLAAANSAKLADALAAEMPYLSWEEVAALSGKGFAFGNHTATHPNMARLSDSEQAAEIAEAQETLAAHGIVTTHFAYPFGHHNDSTPRLAREQGLTRFAEVGGSNAGGESEFVGRVDVTATSTAELFAQLEIVEPAKAWLRKFLRKPKAGWAGA